MTVYADAFALPEDDRIELIGETAAAGALVGVIVEDDAKADRYVKKLTERFIGRVRIVDRMKGPVKNTILIRVGPQGN